MLPACAVAARASRVTDVALTRAAWSCSCAQFIVHASALAAREASSPGLWRWMAATALSDASRGVPWEYILRGLFEVQGRALADNCSSVLQDESV